MHDEIQDYSDMKECNHTAEEVIVRLNRRLRDLETSAL